LFNLVDLLKQKDENYKLVNEFKKIEERKMRGIEEKKLVVEHKEEKLARLQRECHTVNSNYLEQYEKCKRIHATNSDLLCRLNSISILYEKGLQIFQDCYNKERQILN